MTLSTIKNFGVTLYVFGLVSVIISLVFLAVQFGDWTEFLSILFFGAIVSAMFFITGNYARKTIRPNKLLEAGIKILVIVPAAFAVVFPTLIYLTFGTEQVVYAIMLTVFTVLAIAVFVLGLILFIVGKIKE